ncbi:FecCD family ABC transporter permease [Campylobacter sp.]|uniref:FecCD family ABC transporter permease n=1 Tax=Campylobacter sp. TaxID=205 RepID=UPI002710A932|nr:iron ABC transporter permease [Campylobacter sp.]
MKNAAKFIYILPILAVFICINFGSSQVDMAQILNELKPYLAGKEVSADASIIFDIRLPRVILAVLVGAILSGSGAVMQGIFKNPLVDPFLLGVSSGAAFGCALSIGLFPEIPTQILAFSVSVACAFLVLFIANLSGGGKIALILSGVVLSAFLSAFTGLIKFFIDPRHVQAITMWLLGSFSLADWDSVVIAFLAILGGFVPIYLISWRIDILSLDDTEAQTLGVSVKYMRIFIIILLSFSCALAVSLSGIIGWIGLLTPHIARFIVGPSMKSLIPASLCIGGFLLLIADTMARSASVYDLPVGIITAIIGAPFFVILLKKARQDWS